MVLKSVMKNKFSLHKQLELHKEDDGRYSLHYPTIRGTARIWKNTLYIRKETIIKILQIMESDDT